MCNSSRLLQEKLVGSDKHLLLRRHKAILDTKSYQSFEMFYNLITHHNETFKNIHPLGCFVQKSATMRISDPAYSLDIKNSGRVEYVQPGLWQAAVLKTKRSNGTRNALLLVKMASCDVSFADMSVQAFSWEKLNCELCSDSGILGCFDEKYYQDATCFGYNPIADGRQQWIQGCQKVVRTYPFASVVPYGALSVSGEGEGFYDCYLLREANGLVTAIALDFLI